MGQRLILEIIAFHRVPMLDGLNKAPFGITVAVEQRGEKTVAAEPATSASASGPTHGCGRVGLGGKPR
jgi:hypothetical protein